MRKAQLLAATALIGLAMPHTARAGSLYAFGDSLSDNGNLYKLINYPPPPYYEGHFSNGPVWVEYLPGLSGLQFTPSQDYAVGGAYTGNLTVNGVNYYQNYVDYETGLFLKTLPGVTDEIAQFTAAGGHFSSSDVVTLWAGANNYFLYLSLAQANPSQAASLVASGVPTTISQLTADTQALINLGARTLIVPNLPNLGSTPDFNTTTASADLANAFSGLHDQMLPSAIETLHKSTGANILVLNTQALVANVIANPSYYGFSNVTNACVSTPACVSADTATQNTYLFWDGVHPTTHAQYILAQYAAASLSGFDALSVPARVGSANAAAFTTLLSNRMDALRGAGSGYTYVVPAGGAMPSTTVDPDRKLQLYLAGGGTFGGWNNSGNTLGYTGTTSAFALGADYALRPDIHIGLALGNTNGNANVNDGGGTVTDNTFNAGLYGLAVEGRFYAEASLSYGANWYKTQHAGVLGSTVKGTPKGDSFGASAFSGYAFPVSADVALIPSAGLLITSNTLQSYTETGDPFLNQAVDNQGYAQVLGQLGLEAAANTTIGNAHLAPYGSVGMQARLSGANGKFTSSFADMPAVSLTTTYPNQPAAWALLTAGVAAQITNRFSASAAMQTTAFKSNGNVVSISAAVSYAF